MQLLYAQMQKRTLCAALFPTRLGYECYAPAQFDFFEKAITHAQNHSERSRMH